MLFGTLLVIGLFGLIYTWASYIIEGPHAPQIGGGSIVTIAALVPALVVYQLA